MRGMSNRMRVSLDRYITGNYGEDFFRDEDAVCENCGEPCDYDSEMCLCEECQIESGLKVVYDGREWICENCGDVFEPYSESDFCDKCKDKGLTGHAAIGELVVRLLSAGDLYITEIEELGYLVVWTSEDASVKAHDRKLIRALEHADENVSLIANYG